MSVHRFNKPQTVPTLPVAQRESNKVRSKTNAILLLLSVLCLVLYVVYKQLWMEVIQVRRREGELTKALYSVSLYNKSFIINKMTEFIDINNMKLHELYTQKNRIFEEYDQYSKATGQSSSFIQSKISYLERKISKFLYEKEEDREKRMQFHKHRFNVVEKYPQIRSLKLAKYNMVTYLIDEKEKETDLQQNYEQLRQAYQFDLIKTQLPMCVLVVGYNNNVDFRVELNLNSIFQQNYQKYKVIIVDDASDDGTLPLIKKYLEFYPKSKERSLLIVNGQRDGTLQVIYKNAKNHCSPADVVLVVDGSDQLIGRNVLKTLNAVFQTQKAGFLYSTPVLVDNLKTQAKVEWNRSMKDTQIQANNYRQGTVKYSQMRAWKASLLLELKEQDLKDGFGGFLRLDDQMHMILPLLELACGRVVWLDEHQYLKNVKIADRVLEDEERELQRLKKGSKYECSKMFLKEIYLNEAEMGPKRQ